MRSKRYIKEIGIIHSVLLVLCSIFAISGIMYASTTMVGLTIVSQEEYNANSGSHLSGNTNPSSNNHGYTSNNITVNTKKTFIIADNNTEHYNPPSLKDLMTDLWDRYIVPSGKEINRFIPNRITAQSYHGSAEENMCIVDNIYFVHNSGELTPLERAHNLLDRGNPTILDTDRTQKIYSRRFLFSQIIVL